MKRISYYLMMMVLVAGGAFAAPTAPKEPIYVYLYARVTDHVNLDITEDRLRRVLPMIERYRKEHPEAHVSAEVLFSGAVSQALAQRNSETHMVDFVRGYIRRGVIEPGYDGTDEPTYEHRPVLDFSNAQTAEDRWLARESVDEKLLAEGRDPLTGAPEPGKAGGLKEMEKVFGNATCITGLTLWMNAATGGQAVTRARLPGEEEAPKPKRADAFLTGLQPEVGGDSELVQLFRRDHTKALLFGIADTNPGHVAGFGEGRAGFSRLISPVPETAPEVYWQDNVLRSSEASGSVRLVHAYDGPEAMKGAIDKANRSTIHVIHVELASQQSYLQPEFIKGQEFPPLKYAYDHPDAPKLPQDALLPAAAVDAAFAKEDALLKWLVGDFFPSNLGSRVVSSTELMQMAAPSTGFSVSVEGLREGLKEFLKEAGNDTFLPALFRADGHYLSLADMFQAMTDALAEFSRTGKFPNSVKVDAVYGPVRVYTGHGPNEGEVTVVSIAHVCAEIDGNLHDDSPGKIPKNAIPNFIKVDDITMNPAQFLRLMAHAMVTPSPDAKFPVRMTYMRTGVVEMYPKLRRLSDDGFGWTLKPAPLETKPEANQEAQTAR